MVKGCGNCLYLLSYQESKQPTKELRATSKLKELLHRYYCEFSLTEKGEFQLFMTDTMNIDQEVHVFIAPNFSTVVSKGHSYFQKQKKNASGR